MKLFGYSSDSEECYSSTCEDDVDPGLTSLVVGDHCENPDWSDSGDASQQRCSGGSNSSYESDVSNEDSVLGDTDQDFERYADADGQTTNARDVSNVRVTSTKKPEHPQKNGNKDDGDSPIRTSCKRASPRTRSSSFLFEGVEIKPCFVNVTPIPNKYLRDWKMSYPEEQVDLQTLYKGVFSCNICSFRTHYKRDLEQHKFTHRNLKCYKCSHCNRKFASKIGVSCHTKEKHQDAKQYDCGTCRFKTISYSTFRQHQREHHGATYECWHCGYSTNKRGGLIQHMQTHSGAKPFACPHCPYRARQYPHLRHHVFCHLNLKPYACHLCDFKARQSSHLKVHLRTMHSGDRPYSCDKCDFTTKTPHTLRVHYRGQHTNLKPYVCDLCPFKSAHSAGLYCHRKGHRNKFENSCPECSWSTTFHPTLINHLSRYHPDSKHLLRCRRCQYRALDEGKLREHLKNKHGISFERGALVVRFPLRISAATSLAK